MIFSLCAFLHATTSCWCAGVQYRSFCECEGDINTNNFSSVHFTLAKPNSGNVIQNNSNADFLPILLTGKWTWPLCSLKTFHFKSIRPTFRTVPLLRFICWNILDFDFYCFRWKSFSLSLQSSWREVLFLLLFEGARKRDPSICPSLGRMPLYVALSSNSCGKNCFRRPFGFQMGPFFRQRVL